MFFLMRRSRVVEMNVRVQLVGYAITIIKDFVGNVMSMNFSVVFICLVPFLSAVIFPVFIVVRQLMIVSVLGMVAMTMAIWITAWTEAFAVRRDSRASM